MLTSEKNGPLKTSLSLVAAPVFSKLIVIIFEFVHHDLIDKLLLTASVGAEQATSLYLSEWRSRFWRHAALLSNNLLETVSMKILCKLFITLIFV